MVWLRVRTTIPGGKAGEVTRIRTVPSFTAAQIRAAEAPLLAAGIPLMARAAAALAHIATEFIGSAGSDQRVLVIAGSGDNGGDALFAAARLTGRANVDVLLTRDRCHLAGLQAALDAGARQVNETEASERSYGLVIDGIVGIGASGSSALRGASRRIVEALLPSLLSAAVPILAVDVPSGVQPDTGEADDAVLPATTTVVFGGLKHGLTTGRGAELAGHLILVKIGIDEELARLQPVGSGAISALLDAMSLNTATP